MSNQVTIKLDSRVMYLVVAAVAVIGIFVIGYWLGNQLNAPQTAATQQDAAAAAQLQVDPGAAALGQPGAAGAGAAGAQVQAGAPEIQVGSGDSVAVNPGAAVAAGKPVSVAEVPAGETEPRLWVEGLEETNWVYDFGTIPSGEPSEKDFTVTNTGNAELVIQEATASCGCTAALVENPNLAPGETTVVRVSYDPRVNREAGKFIQKQIRIKSNDPLVPLAEFTISADVAAD